MPEAGFPHRSLRLAPLSFAPHPDNRPEPLMNSSMLDLHAISSLFNSDPVSATFLVLLIGITGIAVCVAAYLGASAACDMLREKRKERMREVAFARDARRN